ncbi:hypothetical protein EJB05_11895 [Eragrostis curvula]|uniref:FBD domain-containing protein n=1 Tax=Eragrostis curvula TaxID=38414 RepID=A0A5J9VSI0_9POAL|nr:hypothetical protein EJB05_11895 [Eragrostis curvula]
MWRFASKHPQLSFSDLLRRAEMERGPNSLSLLELPACERATRIELTRLNFPLGFPQTGTFAELLVLRINKAKVFACDVGRLVSTQCPRLRELQMVDVDGITASVISINSTTLARIIFRRVNINKGVQLEVTAPELLYLALDDCGDRSAAATISAPMLTQLIWNHEYDPSCHRIEEADRLIYRLVLTSGSKTSSSPLLGRFDSVDELRLHLSMPLGAEGYNKFIQDMDELPKATVLDVKGLSTKQHLGPAMLHLLGKCSRLKKLKIDISPPIPKETLCERGCSCVPPEIWTTNDIELGSLEEVEISSFTGAKEEMEFLELLFSCKIKTRRIAIHTRSDASLSREKQRQIWALSRPCCIVLECENTQFI